MLRPRESRGDSGGGCRLSLQNTAGPAASTADSESPGSGSWRSGLRCCQSGPGEAVPVCLLEEEHLSDQGPTFMTSPNLNHFLKSSQYSHSGVMNLGGTQAFSP